MESSTLQDLSQQLQTQLDEISGVQNLIQGFQCQVSAALSEHRRRQLDSHAAVHDALAFVKATCQELVLPIATIKGGLDAFVQYVDGPDTQNPHSTPVPCLPQAKSAVCPFQARLVKQKPADPFSREDLAEQEIIAEENGTGRERRLSTTSLNKCPIRMLDDKSVEEIAEFIDQHKHEVPRSHEICVKRYQSSAENLHKLNARYGNLEGMIQDLGHKHQAMMPDDTEIENFQGLKGKERVAIDSARSLAAVPRSPFSDVDPAQEDCCQSDFLAHNEHDRVNHFARPLEEVRLGESPTRPWGIQIPMATTNSREAHHVTSEVPQSAAEVGQKHDRLIDRSSQAQNIFTGPVFFVGYPPEQASNFARSFSAAGSFNAGN